MQTYSLRLSPYMPREKYADLQVLWVLVGAFFASLV